MIADEFNSQLIFTFRSIMVILKLTMIFRPLSRNSGLKFLFIFAMPHLVCVLFRTCYHFHSQNLDIEF